MSAAGFPLANQDLLSSTLLFVFLLVLGDPSR